jgi:hypothetical protein
MKLVRLIKICLNETYRKSSMVKIRSISCSEWSEKGGVSSPVLLNVASEYAIRKVQEDQERLALNRRRHFEASFSDVNTLSENICTIMNSKVAVLEICL